MDDARLDLLISLNRYREAEAAAREAIGADPRWAHGYSHLARALLGQDKLRDAEQAAREGVRKAPDDAWAHAVLGVVLNCRHRYKDAHRAGLDALRLWPNYPLAHRVIANAAAGLKRYKVAALAAADGLAHDPTDEGLIAAKAWAEYRQGKMPDAAATAEAGLAAHPASADLLHLLGCVRWEQAKRALRPRTRLRLHREADALFADAVRQRPTEPAFRDNRRANALACRAAVVGWLAGLVAVGTVATLSLVAVATGWMAEKFIAGLALASVGLIFCWPAIATAEIVLAVLPVGVPMPPPGRLARWAGVGYCALVGAAWLGLTLAALVAAAGGPK